MRAARLVQDEILSAAFLFLNSVYLLPLSTRRDAGPNFASTDAELMDRLAGITTDRLTDLAGRLFFNCAPTLSAIGPVEQLASMDEISQLLNGGATSGHKTAAE